MNDALGSRSNKPAAEGVFSLCLRFCRCFQRLPVVQTTAGTGSSKRLSDKYPATLNLYLNPTQQHGTIPAAERWWHDGHNEPSSVGDSDPGGKAQGSLRPAGSHPEDLPRTRRDHASATRQELPRFDREDGIFNSQKKQRI